MLSIKNAQSLYQTHRVEYAQALYGSVQVQIPDDVIATNSVQPPIVRRFAPASMPVANPAFYNWPPPIQAIY